eukprot:scaffold124731_cov16-Tisochrysis_lutea.AAC.1
MCATVPGQRRTKLTPMQTREIIKLAAQRPQVSVYEQGCWCGSRHILVGQGGLHPGVCSRVGKPRPGHDGNLGPADGHNCVQERKERMRVHAGPDTWLQGCNLTSVDARVLPQPVLAYGNPAAFDVGTKGAWCGWQGLGVSLLVKLSRWAWMWLPTLQSHPINFQVVHSNNQP